MLMLNLGPANHVLHTFFPISVLPSAQLKELPPPSKALPTAERGGERTISRGRRMRRGRGVTGDSSLRRRLMTERTRNSEGKSVTVSNFAPLHPTISDGRGKFVCGGGKRRRTSLREREKRKGNRLSLSVVQGFNSIVQKHYLS